MATLRSVDDLVGRFVAMEKALGPKEQRPRMMKAGLAMKPLGLVAARKDLGADAAFSGWRRNNPIALEVAFKIHRDGQGVTMHRAGKSAGPWRVAESGRNTAEGPRLVGPRLTKTGKVSRARTKRWNGRTEGKGTWESASALMGKVGPKVLSKLNREDVIKAATGRRT